VLLTKAHVKHLIIILIVACYLKLHPLKMLGCLNPKLGQIWTNPTVGLRTITFMVNRTNCI